MHLEAVPADFSMNKSDHCAACENNQLKQHWDLEYKLVIGSLENLQTVLFLWPPAAPLLPQA